MLWDLENQVRNEENSDKEFRKTTRLMFKYKEVRNQLKNDINIITSSEFRDIKEYR